MVLFPTPPPPPAMTLGSLRGTVVLEEVMKVIFLPVQFCGVSLYHSLQEAQFHPLMSSFFFVCPKSNGVYILDHDHGVCKVASEPL